LQYKTLYITNQFPVPGTNSGAFTIQRIKALQRSGIDVVVVCPVNKTPPRTMALNIKGVIEWVKKQSALPDLAEVDGIPAYYLKRFQMPQPVFGWYSYLFLYWQTIGELKKIISQVKPDIIISAWLPSGVVACKLGKRIGVPVIVLAEGSDVNILTEEYHGWSFARNTLNRDASALVFVSHALKERAVRAGLEDNKARVIYNGVNAETFSLKEKKRSSGRREILFVGRLSPEKGLQFLLEAFHKVIKKNELQVKLTIVGDGALKDALYEQVDHLKLGDVVNFVDSMPQKDLAKYYWQADLLCLPSLREGFPCVIIEAMACGTPVVASRVGGIVEIIDPLSGIMVSPGEPDELAEALIDALTMEWDAKLIRKHVIDSFTWNHTGKAFLGLVQEAIEKQS